MARVAILIDDAFEDSELRAPWERLRRAGHEVTIVGRRAGAILTGKRGQETVKTELSVADVTVDRFDALVIPGGRSPERLLRDARAVQFARAFAGSGKPLAANCHGPLLLAAAGVVAGRTLTSHPAIRDELVASGATWVDEERVEDGALITSRRPADLPAFTRALLGQLEPRERPLSPAWPA
jgi:protease I